jgi:hypothetical protein
MPLSDNRAQEAVLAAHQALRFDPSCRESIRMLGRRSIGDEKNTPAATARA